ncbi:sister chromatid cohesion protein 1 [Elasticomyces elasticus]|nr:sister chromatid cohesion protein 1 [Elasticomyces elasticus]
MASVKNEEALQQQLDKALKVADYLKRKLNSLEEIIGDLSEQDVNALFEGYSDDMESLEKTIGDPAASPTAEMTELKAMRMSSATPPRSTSGSMNMLKGVDPTPEARPADVMPGYPYGANIGAMVDAARRERREEHIKAPSMSPITRPMDVPVPRRRAKNLSHKLLNTYAGVLKSIRAKEKKTTAAAIAYLLARQAREEMILAEARKRAEDVVFEEECAAELAVLEAEESMEEAKATAIEAEVAAIETEEARMKTELLRLRQASGQATWTSYAHGVYSVRCGIREISHAVKRESRGREQALQKLDEAQRVALYLQKKLESLEETITDLSQGQDVKVGMKDYDEGLEKLAKSVLKEASIQHAVSQRKTASATKRKRQDDAQPEIVPSAKRQQQSDYPQRARSLSIVQCQDDDHDMTEPVAEAQQDDDSRRKANLALLSARLCAAPVITPLLPRPDCQPQEQPVQLLATPAPTPEVSVVPSRTEQRWENSRPYLTTFDGFSGLLAASRLAAIPTSQQRQYGRRERVIHRDYEIELRSAEIKLQNSDTSAITRSHTPLPKNKTLLNLLQHQQQGGFVGDIMRNDRMLNWAPELRKIFAFGERDPFGPLAEEPRSTVSRMSKKTPQGTDTNACLGPKEKHGPSTSRTRPGPDAIMIDDKPCYEASRPEPSTSRDNVVVTKAVRRRETPILDLEMTVDAPGLELADDASSGLSSPDRCGPVIIDDGLRPAAVSWAEDMQMREAAEALAGLDSLGESFSLEDHGDLADETRLRASL